MGIVTLLAALKGMSAGWGWAAAAPLGRRALEIQNCKFVLKAHSDEVLTM